MRFKAAQGTFFVLQRSSGVTVLSWHELTRDYITAGYEVVDWFRASNRHVAVTKAVARHSASDTPPSILQPKSLQTEGTLPSLAKKIGKNNGQRP